MKIIRKPEDEAFHSNALPCNPVPFLNRMIELVRIHGTDVIKTPEYQANLWVLNSMPASSCLTTIDLPEKYTSLVHALTPFQFVK